MGYFSVSFVLISDCAFQTFSTSVKSGYLFSWLLCDFPYLNMMTCGYFLSLQEGNLKKEEEKKFKLLNTTFMAK